MQIAKFVKLDFIVYIAAVQIYESEHIKCSSVSFEFKHENVLVL